MLWLYNIATSLYGLIVRIFSLFNPKAALFIKGRQNIFKKIADKINPAAQHVWFHFASLGEFEQGRPVLEQIKKQHPDKNIVVTFFSPSGYEVRKDYALAEGIFYLPLDTAANARKLVNAINPQLAIFTKYEYWYHYFQALHKKNVPIFIISGIFRPGQVYFKWYGAFNRKILSFVKHFFVQNEESKMLLSSIGLQNVSISGDTRFDRVAENAAAPKSFDLVAEFTGPAKVVVAGSTWPEDERLLAKLMQDYPDWKFIIAPHEIHAAHIDEIQGLLPNALRYSQLSAGLAPNVQCLIIDNIGLLSALYQYGNIAYIGGGFGAGIHNTLEAAAFGIPVIFGPKYDKFQEAKDLITLGAAISIGNQEQLVKAFKSFSQNDEAGKQAAQYVQQKKGSTDQILHYIKEYF